MKQVKFTMLLGIALIISAASANGGNLTLSPGFVPDPHILEYASGGSLDASGYESRNLSEEACGGYINGEEPDHILTLTEDFDYLRVYVETDEPFVDTTMMIITPGTEANVYCYDDQYGLSPMTQSAWEAGTYYIYIGNYDEPNEYDLYRLYVTEFREED